MKNIIIAGYPRSGNVAWARILGDLYNCSITGSEKNRISIANKVGNNKKIKIIQEHYSCYTEHKQDRDTFINGRYINPLNKPDDYIICYVYRHPFDVVTSVYKYWDIASIEETLYNMRNGNKVPAYDIYMNGWLQYLNFKDFRRTSLLDILLPFFTLKHSPEIAIEIIKLKVLNKWNIKPEITVKEACERNSFICVKKRIKDNPDQFSYNQGIQNKHMRKGEIGDWINYFTKDDIDLALDFMENTFTEYLYVPRKFWFKKDIKNNLYNYFCDILDRKILEKIPR